MEREGPGALILPPPRWGDMAAGIVGVGYKTGPTTPLQIGGVRFSEAKEAQKSKALIIAVIRAISSRDCRMGGQPQMGCRLRYFVKS